MLAISMSEYDWCPVFAASNREYLCSRLVLAAVPASKRSGVLFQAVLAAPSSFIAPEFDSSTALCAAMHLPNLGNLISALFFSFPCVMRGLLLAASSLPFSITGIRNSP